MHSAMRPRSTFRRANPTAGSTTLVSRRTVTLVAGAAALVATLAGCAKKTQTTAAPGPTQRFKIGIMTGTASRAEPDFRAGEQVERRYPGRVMHVTYPDNFASELETVIAQLKGLAADPRIRVIIVGEAIPGSATAARRIRETRADIRIGFVDPHEDPDTVDSACDIAIQPDEAECAAAVVAMAQEMGARNLVHYSFPRHMSQGPLAERRDLMVRECEKRGMNFRFATAPDPAGESGLAGARQFVLEDVPRQLEKLGPATAFLGSSDSLEEAMIEAILKAGKGYFVAQDVAAPARGLSTALGIRIPPDKTDDAAWIQSEIGRRIAERGMSGHFGAWAQPADMVTIRAFASLLVDAADKKADCRDSATVARYLEVEAGGPVRLRRHGKGNQWLVLLDHVTY
jgi:Protein of unknown function (DUF3798)